jgi:heme-degrading monooxygenase HmoA
MTQITTIVHFEVPEENIDEFLSFWQKTREAMVKQPGITSGIFYRGTDPDAPFQFINVAHWKSAEALEAGLQGTDEELRQRYGITVVGSLKDLDAKVLQNNYVEGVDYTQDIRH